MKYHYCRYCKADVPMFNDNEYEELKQIYLQCVETIKDYRRVHSTTLSETPLVELYRPPLNKYQELAGVQSDFVVGEIMRRHYLSRWK